MNNGRKIGVSIHLSYGGSVYHFLTDKYRTVNKGKNATEVKVEET